MKTYIVVYTEDCGSTYQNTTVESASYTSAYIAVNLMLPSSADIISVSVQE